jgi:hypothetical protein
VIKPLARRPLGPNSAPSSDHIGPAGESTTVGTNARIADGTPATNKSGGKTFMSM